MAETDRGSLRAESLTTATRAPQQDAGRKERARLRHVLEHVGLRLALFLGDRLPLRSTARLATCLADLWFFLNVRRRQTAQDNIRQSGIADDPVDIARIARESFRHFALLVVESLKGSTLITEANWREHAVVEAPHATMELIQKPGQGIILVSGHLGNWEIAAQLLSYFKPVVGVTRSMNNPRADKLIRERKARGRFRLTPKHDADASRFLSALRNGEILALLMDQHAREQGMTVEFFGRPAATHTSPAMLHLVTGAPICFGACIRTAPMTFRLIASAPLIHPPTGNREQDVRAILEPLTRQLEAAIRENPAQYLWAHRRWR